jgi:hypothetical protein
VNKKFSPYHKRVEKLCKHFSWELLYKFVQNMKKKYYILDLTLLKNALKMKIRPFIYTSIFQKMIISLVFTVVKYSSVR